MHPTVQIYCSNCGVVPGTVSECPHGHVASRHDFVRLKYPMVVYCARCGAVPGIIPTECSDKRKGGEHDWMKVDTR